MKAAVGTLLLTAIFAVPAAADIRVWSEKDRQGDGREIRRAVRDLRNYGFDDRISSLETDEAWEVCTEPLYRGDCRIVQGVVPNLRMLGLNNRITSMRRASEEMLTELWKPPETPRNAEPVPQRSARSASNAPPASGRTKAEPVPSTSTRKPEPAPSAAAIKAEPVPSTPIMKPEPAPERSASAETIKPEPLPKPSASAETIKPEPVPSAPVTKPEPLPEPSASAETIKPEPVPSAPVTKPGADATASAKNEPAEADLTPADGWRSVKPPPAPAPEPAPVTGEWWQGGDETAGAPPTLDLFEKPNFEGRRVRLDQAISDLTQLDQSVGSLLVRTGSWQICSKPKFRGRCRTVDATGMGVPETPLIGSLRPETD